MNLTPKQIEITDAIKELGQASALEIAAIMNTCPKAVSMHLRRLQSVNIIHLCAWGEGRSGNPMKIFKMGRGDPAIFLSKPERKRMTLEEKRKQHSNRYDYDPFADIVQNTGWISTIHCADLQQHHGEHIRYMQRFVPRPDPASAWLFIDPRVELLGAKYD